MRFGLSNDEWFYVEQNDIKLIEIDGDYHIVGGQILYGISESGTRYRLNPDVSTKYFEEYTTEYRIIDAIYDPVNDTYEEVYGDVPVWTLTDITLDTGFAIPNSMNANDTYNFDNFSIPMLLVFAVAIFVSFRVFNR